MPSYWACLKEQLLLDSQKDCSILLQGASWPWSRRGRPRSPGPGTCRPPLGTSSPPSRCSRPAPRSARPARPRPLDAADASHAAAAYRGGGPRPTRWRQGERAVLAADCLSGDVGLLPAGQWHVDAGLIPTDAFQDSAVPLSGPARGLKRRQKGLLIRRKRGIKCPSCSFLTQTPQNH